MAKLRHVAISVPDVEKAAAFYQQAFGLTRVGEARGPTADGIYLSDGTINLALLRYKDDEPMGEGKDKDWFGVHHIGFWVDDTAEQRKQVEAAGGRWLMGEMEGTGIFYELKFTDPFGNIFDLTHNGWGGARKDGPPPAGEAPRKKRVTKARRVIATGSGRGTAKAGRKPGRKTVESGRKPGRKAVESGRKPARAAKTAARKTAKRAAPKRRAAASRAASKRTAKRRAR
jgi:methylmalonyl-CoA/ethylmalonyl-CoA epimerase